MEYLERDSWEAMLIIATVAIAWTWAAGTRFITTAYVTGFAFPAIILVRVELDGFRDPTSHNLWPFEVGAALVIGMVVSWSAAGIGWLLRRATNRSRAL